VSQQRQREYLVFDLETVLDPELPPPPPREPDKKDGLPAPIHWRIVAFGAAMLQPVEGGGFDVRIGHMGEKFETWTERGAIAAFIETLTRRNPVVSGWNSRSFDMPIVHARAFRYGLPFPHLFRSGLRRRYDGHHIDVMDEMSEHGATRPARAGETAKAMGLPGKLDVDGSSVEALYQAGEIERIIAYCLQDVAQETAILLRHLLVRGTLDLAAYRASIGAWTLAIEGCSRTAAILPRCDMARLRAED